MRQQLLADVVELSLDECTGCGFVSASAEGAGDLVALYGTTTPETDFEASDWLLDHDDGELSPLNLQAVVDQVLSIGRQGARLIVVLFSNIGMCKIAIQLGLDPLQHKPFQPQPPERFAFVKVAKNTGRRGTGVNQFGTNLIS